MLIIGVLMYNLSAFGFNDMMALRSRLRSIVEGAGPASVEGVAQKIVELFRTSFVDDEGRPACALVRVFKTHQFSGLDDELRSFVRTRWRIRDYISDFRCLVLLATGGDEPAWNDRRLSNSHRAIPLQNEEMVRSAPMIAQLFQQVGGSVASVLRPHPSFFIDGNQSYNLFYVPDALGSPYIVDQEEFVKRYGIRSVLGFGGMLASGDFIATILFSRVPISAEVADSFKVIGLNFKLVMLRVVAERPIFDVDEA